MWLFRTLFLILVYVPGQAQIFQYQPLITEEIESGLKWEYYHFKYEKTPYSVNLLEIDPSNIISLFYSEDRLMTIQEFLNKNTIAAINGSFFNMKEGGSVVFMQEGKKLVASVRKNRFSDEGAFARTKKGDYVILERPEKGWKKRRKYDYILSSGPLLLVNGNKNNVDSSSFYMKRHPRTAACINSSGKVLFVTVDGRNEAAVGASIPELQNLMKELDCYNALNLDGGGSTSMFVKNRTQNGIVNFPSDNKTFDHKGVRKIANGFSIISSSEK